jgi:hypothetical protein
MSEQRVATPEVKRTYKVFSVKFHHSFSNKWTFVGLIWSSFKCTYFASCDVPTNVNATAQPMTGLNGLQSEYLILIRLLGVITGDYF